MVYIELVLMMSKIKEILHQYLQIEEKIQKAPAKVGTFGIKSRFFVFCIEEK